MEYRLAENRAHDENRHEPNGGRRRESPSIPGGGRTARAGGRVSGKAWSLWHRRQPGRRPEYRFRGARRTHLPWLSHDPESGVADAERLSETQRRPIGPAAIQLHSIGAARRINKSLPADQRDDGMAPRDRRVRQANVSLGIAANR